jgi:prepilin-type N-terminal cleavage/methylation domain-containing protein
MINLFGPHIHLKRGFTLIALLISIAIISILSYMIIHSARTVRIMQERQQTWQDALHLAEDQMTRLRTAQTRPETGIHPVDPDLLSSYKLPGQAVYELSDGPGTGLRKLGVRIQLHGHASERKVELAAIIPDGTYSGGTTP